MSVLQVTYQLGGPESSSSYNELISAIKALGSWAKPMKSVRFVETTSNVSRVSKHLHQYLDSNDTLLVMNVTGDYRSGYGLGKDVVNWMQQRI